MGGDTFENLSRTHTANHRGDNVVSPKSNAQLTTTTTKNTTENATLHIPSVRQIPIEMQGED